MNSLVNSQYASEIKWIEDQIAELQSRNIAPKRIQRRINYYRYRIRHKELAIAFSSIANT